MNPVPSKAALSVIKALPETNIGYAFCSEELKQRYVQTLHRHLSFCYFLLQEDVVVSFALFMDESANLELGFLEYQVPDSKRTPLARRFKGLSEDTLYLNYLYTDKMFRHQHISTWFLQHIMAEETVRFSHIWLKRETDSRLFDRCGFKNFHSAVEEIVGPANFQTYFADNRSAALARDNREYLVSNLQSNSC